MNGQEFPTSIARNSPKHEFPTGHDFDPYNQYPQQSGYPPGIPSGTPPPPPQHQDLTIDGIPNLPAGGPGNGGGGGGGGPFPHRRSRASRTFKNPPQPHMCIREKTIDGKEVFINVLSWTRIANPDNPDAPIPLYGGMKVGKIPPGSPRAPPLVYAVMASPEVLKKAGRKCPDTPERMNLVDLMCEFVEAMNPTLHLSRKPEILKDRDLSGELKDVWSAVQACRDKGRVDSVGPPENLVVYTEFGPETAPSYEQSQHHQQQQHQQYHHQQHFPHHQHQQQHHHYGGDPFHQQQQQPQQNHHQQSAITNNSSSSSSNNNVDANSSDSPDAPDCATVSDQHLDELCQEADSLKIAPSKSNGLTLPTTTTTTSPSGSAEATPATSPESNPVPAASTAATPQQQGNSSSSSLSTHSPTSPTSTTATPVSPTATTPSPATPQKESKNTSHFFPMFRSSKSSSAEKSAEKSADANGGSPADPAVANSAAAGTQPDTPVKTSSKKSGLNFFRRNKTDSKKSTTTTTEAPATPTKQKDSAPSAGEKLIDKLDESLQHLQHHHHHHGGSNGTGEIIENSSATIVAK